MKFYARRLSVFAIALIVCAVTGRSQSLGEELAKVAKLGSLVAEGYVTPLASGLGNGMNTALYHSADLHSILGFDVGVKVGIAQITDAEKTFTFDMPASITVTHPLAGSVTFLRGTHYSAQVTGQSAAGEKTVTEVKTIAANGLVPAGYPLFELPQGAGLPVAGAIAPQASIGLPFGIEVMGRFLPTQEFDAGKFGMTGFGVRYDVDQWLPLFPVDIAVHFAMQKTTLKDKADKDVLTASAKAYGVEVSKGLLFLTVYGGFQLESSEVEVADITAQNFQGQPITLPGFTVEGSNKSRVTVGARLLLLFLSVHAEYSIAETPMLGVGVAITLR